MCHRKSIYIFTDINWIKLDTLSTLNNSDVKNLIMLYPCSPPFLPSIWLYFWKIFLKKVALGVQYVINNSLPLWNSLTYFQVTGNTVGRRPERGGKPATSKSAPLRESRMYPLQAGISERPSDLNVKSLLSSWYIPNPMNEQPYNTKFPTFFKLNVISKDKSFFSKFFSYFFKSREFLSILRQKYCVIRWKCQMSTFSFKCLEFGTIVL